MLQNGILAGIAWPSPVLMIAAIVLSALVVPYLLGSINSAVLVSRAFYHEDIREKGSGNAGLTNTHRVYGKKAAGLVLLGDVLKMVLSLLIVGLLFGMQYGPFAFSFNPFLYVAGTVCILGHVFPVYFKFKGGKGVLCTAAMVLTLSPLAFVALFLIFVLLLWVTRYVSASSVTVGLAYPFVLNRFMAFFCGATGDGLMTLLPVFIALLIVYCHRSNLSRLRNHTESKFSFKKKDGK